MANAQENEFLKNFFVSVAVTDIVSEVVDVFEHSVVTQVLDASDSEEEDDIYEVHAIIEHCRSIMQV